MASNSTGSGLLRSYWVVALARGHSLAAAVSVAATPCAYVANYGGNTVSIINTATNVAAGPPVTVGSRPWGIDFLPDGSRAYVANEVSGSVSVLNTTTNTIVATIPVGSSPHGLAVTPDGTRVYVVNFFSNSVSVIDTATNAVVDTIAVGANPREIAVTPDGAKAYAVNHAFGTSASSVSVIATSSNSVIATIPTPPGPSGSNEGPTVIGITPDGARAYVVANATHVVVIDTSLDIIADTIVGSGYFNAVAVSADGLRLYVNATGEVTVFDIPGHTVIDHIPVSSAGPDGLVLTPDDSKAYVTQEGTGTVAALDTSTHAVTVVPVGPGPRKVAILANCPAASSAPTLLWQRSIPFCVRMPALGNDGYLYLEGDADCATGDGQGIMSIDPTDGTVRWGPVVPPGCGGFGNGVTLGANGLVYATGDWLLCSGGPVAAFAPSDGTIAWQRSGCAGAPHPRHAPALDESISVQSLYFGVSSLCSIAMDDGAPHWEAAAGGANQGGSGMAIDSNHNIYYGTGQPPRVHSFTSDGTLRWSRSSSVIWNAVMGILPGDVLLVRLVTTNDPLVAWDAGGNDLWSVDNLDRPVVDAAGGIYGSSVSGADVVSLTAAGVERWRQTLPGASSAQLDFVDSSGRVYVRGGDTLFALETTDGSIAWSFKACAPLIGAVLAPLGRMFLADSLNNLFMLDTSLDYAVSVWPVAGYGNRRHTENVNDVLSLPAAPAPIGIPNNGPLCPMPTATPIMSPTPPTPSETTTPTPTPSSLCGNGHQDPGEECDLGPPSADSGNCPPDASPPSCSECTRSCSSDCKLIGRCTGSFACCATATECPSGQGCCGNGIIESPPEQCDDGNLVGGDTCTSQCTSDTGIPFTCCRPGSEIAGSTVLVSQKVKLNKLAAPAGDEKFTSPGETILLPGQDIHPCTEGLSYCFEGDSGIVYGPNPHMTPSPGPAIPGSAFGSKPRCLDVSVPDRRVHAIFKDKTLLVSEPDGLSRVQLKNVRTQPNKYKFKVQGKNVNLSAAIGATRLRQTLVVGDTCMTSNLACIDKGGGKTKVCTPAP